MPEHYGHTVQWCTWEGGTYRLYCNTCGHWTTFTAQNVTTMWPVTFETAMTSPYKQQPVQEHPPTERWK